MTKGDAIQFFKDYVQRNQILVNQIIKPAGTDKIMASADDVASWYEATQLYELNRIDEAIEKFKAAKQSSKMLVNIGCCYLRKDDLKSAREMFSNAVKNDPHLALGFFMLGLTFYFQNMLQDALKSFEKSLELLRGNKFVDYRQLGFNFQLYACEILTNIAGAHLRLNDTEKANENITQAYEQKVEKKHNRIEFDIKRVQSNNPKIDLFYPPRSEVFRPSKASVANLKKKNYLGESKVISTDSEEDCYACFSGIKDKVIEQKKQELARSPKLAPKKLNNNNNNNSNENVNSRPPSPRLSAPPSPKLNPSRSPKQRPRYIAPTLDLPQFSLDTPVLEVAGSSRSKSVGSRPNKPLPALVLSADKPITKLVTLEDNINKTFVVSLESSPVRDSSRKTIDVEDSNSNISCVSQKFDANNNNTVEMVEVEIQYSFIKTVRLPRSFSMDQLNTMARQQTLPQQFDFRAIDALGRQLTLKDGEKLEDVQKVVCFPTEQ